MEFIKRVITEEDERWLDKFNIEYPFSSRFTVSYGEWIVENKEDNAFLLRIAGQGAMESDGSHISDLPLVFVLIWQNQCFDIDAFICINTIGENSKNEVEILYDIEKIMSPPGLERYKDKIKKLVMDGITAYGTNIDFLDVKDIRFLNVSEPRFRIGRTTKHTKEK